MIDIESSLDDIVDTTGPNEIEYRNEIELTISYYSNTKQLFVSHFYINPEYRRKNIATKTYNQLLNYAKTNEHISKFRFHIKKTVESEKWLDNMNESYQIVPVGGVGEVFEVNYNFII